MVKEPHLKIGFSIADSTQDQQELSLLQKLLLCGLWLRREDFYYQSSSRTSPSMHDLAKRQANIWLNAHAIATENPSPFWDEVAHYLQNDIKSCGDPNQITGEITGDDLRWEFGAVLERLSGTTLDESGRFSAHQRLMIVCIGYDIRIIESKLPDNLWSNYDDDELDELVKVLSNSTLFLLENVNRDLLKAWLADLERLFT